MFELEFEGVLGKFQGVLRVLPGYFKEVKECFKDVSRLFQGRFQISRVFQVCVQGPTSAKCLEVRKFSFSRFSISEKLMSFIQFFIMTNHDITFLSKKSEIRINFYFVKN